MTKKTRFCFMLLLALLNPVQADVLVEHQLEVSLSPQHQTLKVRDRITLPADGPRVFSLHAGLEPRIITPGGRLSQNGHALGGSDLLHYRVTLPEGARNFTLEYGGKIAHEFSSHQEGPGRVQQHLSGTISPQGVFLDAGVAWYPLFPDSLQAFDLRVELPTGWLAVSQGAGPETEVTQKHVRVHWRETSPQDDIYLIAAPYHFTRSKQGNVEAQVFLRQHEPALAQRYLSATEHYLALYESLLGPYPYAKFALVENFWETGYGMPSFTLLGSRVLRLPFILHTSYPHEILHNWWGNGVFVDYAKGNWSEGLTSYLADHLLKEQRGQGVDYRRSALQRYGNFVRSENDFPLSAFRSRHSGSSQAVGYDKSLMLFHMLRRKLGDQTFLSGLQAFYRGNRFKTAGYPELQRAFEKAAGDIDLGAFFQQWTRRTGAPLLAVSELKVTSKDGGFHLSGRLTQDQQADPFELDVPLLVYLEQGPPVSLLLPMQTKRAEIALDLPARPLRLDVDPWFDLFRTLHAEEAPPTLGQLFGAQAIHFILPASAPQPLLEGYRRMAQEWAAGYENATILMDDKLESLPNDTPVWLFGWENRFLDSLPEQAKAVLPKTSGQPIQIDDNSYDRRDHSPVLTGRQESTGQTLGWVAGVNPAALSGLARKLPHYGKYSYLVFQGDTPDIQHKGLWPVSRSPMRIPLRDDFAGGIEALSPPPALSAGLNRVNSSSVNRP